MGTDHATVSDPLLNLAAVYVARRRFPEAAQFYGRGMAILERVMGSDNARLAGRLEIYAALLRKSENYAEAEKVQVRATGIRVKTALRAEEDSETR